ncbi:MAG: uracil permease [Erysipelothrix sp.]|nr:uracil permease [Erysipelothrix sp.]
MIKNDLLLDVHERPKLGQWAVLSVQHVFAMFGATVLVPIIVGFPISVALFASGLGTLIYIAVTKAKVPVYLGSSFAYITAMIFAREALGGDIGASQTGLIVVGLVYVGVALIIRLTGTKWLDKILPPIVIGPMIMIIGLGLASTAVAQAGFTADGNFKMVAVAAITFLITAFVSTYAKGFFKIIPFVVGIAGGYVVAILFQIVDFTPIANASWLALPELALPFKLWKFDTYQLYFGPEMWAIIPIAIVTISEHIGDHIVLGKICNKDFLKDPGLKNTLIGDGIATSFSALVGGPANTTYGENTGVVGMTKVASIYVIGGAAVIAVILSFFGKFSAAISTIPGPVLGGMSMLLYGVIASNGLRVLVDAKVDFAKQRNLIIASVMLVIGLGGAIFKLSSLATLSGTALAALVGVFLNLVLPNDK